MQRTDRVHLVRTLKSASRGLAQAQITNLASLDQFGHGANGFFNRHVRVHAVLVVQIQGFNPQTLQAALDGLANVLGASVDGAKGRVGRVAHNAELARQKHLLAFAANRLADQFFIAMGAVNIGGIEQVDA